MRRCVYHHHDKEIIITIIQNNETI